MATNQPQRVRMEEVVSQVQDMAYDFFKSFSAEHIAEDMKEVAAGYVEQMQKVRDGVWSTVMVDWRDLDRYDAQLAEVITMEYPRFEPAFRKGFARLMLEFTEALMEVEGADTEKDYYVAFTNVSAAFTIRQLRCGLIGHLVTLKGTITRTSQVRPELASGVFTCLDCGQDSHPVEQNYKYTEPAKCSNMGCTNTTNWSLKAEHGAARFVDWQKIKIQENSNEIPPGSMPRTMDLILRGDCVETVKPGDKCLFVGHLTVLPEVGKLMGTQERNEVQRQLKRSEDGNGRDDAAPAVGMKSLGTREMIYKLAFMVCAVLDNRGGRAPMTKQTVTEDQSDFTPAEIQQIDLMAEDSPMAKLSACIAPNVFGHDAIKLGILLQLLGGVRKHTADGITLRGDVNVCVVGDPSTAKSQFLKFVARTVPRAIYTSGKSSSASGLTATVVKDADTREFTIEAGALMLADEGLCCIDEFDKMDVQDQVAIHESMEQQTISLAKAGLKATLNARASILAAANPIEGRYDKTKPLRANVSMTSPIMSRFDLFFIVTDDLDDEKDEKLAQKIVSLHREGESSAQSPYQVKDFLLYLRYAQQLKPRLTAAAGALLVDQYRKMRDNFYINGKTSVRVTTRQLESMVRLSEAVARLYCSQRVEKKHVKQAIQLMDASLSQLQIDPGRIALIDDESDQEENTDNNNNNDTTDATQDLPALETQDTMLQETQGAVFEEDTQMGGESVLGMGAEDTQRTLMEEGPSVQPAKKRKVKKVHLTHSVFERIKKSILGVLHSRGEAMRQSEMEKMVFSDLGGMEFADGVLSTGTKTIRLVLMHMLKSDTRAYQVIDTTDPKDEDPKDRRILLANFDLDQNDA